MKYFDLSNPKDARRYIEEFLEEGKHPNWMVTDKGRIIEFSKMTDKEAVHVAHLISHLMPSKFDDNGTLH